MNVTTSVYNLLQPSELGIFHLRAKIRQISDLLQRYNRIQPLIENNQKFIIKTLLK